MLNQANLEGFVVNTWAFGRDLYVRLCTYRDPGKPTKRYLGDKDAPDYVNVRFTDGTALGMSFPIKMRIRVEGILQSRDYYESLEEFLQKAKKEPQSAGIAVETIGGKPREILCGRSTWELLVEKHVIVAQPNESVSLGQENTGRKPALNANASAPVTEVMIAPTLAAIAQNSVKNSVSKETQKPVTEKGKEQKKANNRTHRSHPHKSNSDKGSEQPAVNAK